MTLDDCRLQKGWLPFGRHRGLVPALPPTDTRVSVIQSTACARPLEDLKHLAHCQNGCHTTLHMGQAVRGKAVCVYLAEVRLALDVYMYVMCLCSCMYVCVQTSKSEYAACTMQHAARSMAHMWKSEDNLGTALYSSPSTWLETKDKVSSAYTMQARLAGLGAPISASHHTQEHATAPRFTQPPGDSHSGPHPCPSHPEPSPWPSAGSLFFPNI